MKQTIGPLALLASLLFSAGTALAQPAPVAGPPKPPTGLSQAVSGRFNVIQLATVDTEGFKAAWASRGEQVSLPTNDAAVRNQPIATYILFNGCRVDERGNCNVYTDFEVYDPDGQVYARHAAQPQWIGPPDPDGKVMLGVSGLNLFIEKGEKLGAYRVRTFTIDKVANVSVSNEVPISVTEAK